jgi:hypothetical protein
MSRHCGYGSDRTSGEQEPYGNENGELSHVVSLSIWGAKVVYFGLSRNGEHVTWSHLIGAGFSRAGDFSAA